MGCGAVTLQAHGPVLRHLQRSGILRVRGCYDRNAARAQAVARLLKGETWGVEVPAEPPEAVSAVLVATPPQYHASSALMYVQAGRSALIEKPFVGTRSEGDLLVSAARRAGGRLLVGHMRRFFPSVRIARDLVLAGALGSIHRITATEGSRWAWPAASTYVVDDPFGGVLYDTGSHSLDTLFFILGLDDDAHPQIEVEDVARDRESEPSHHFRAEFTIVLKSFGRVPVRLAISRTRALAGALRFEGERGTLLVPPTIAQSPRLIVDGRVFTVDRPTAVADAIDTLGCIKQEYLALLGISNDPDTNTMLDAHRFLALTDLLELLARGVSRA